MVIQPDWRSIDQPFKGIIFGIRSAEGQRIATGGQYNEFVRSIGGTQTVPVTGFACDIVQMVGASTGGSNIHPRIVDLVVGRNKGPGFASAMEQIDFLMITLSGLTGR